MRTPSGRIGTALVAIVLVLVVVGPLVAQHPVNAPNFDDGRGPFGSPHPPSTKYWLGTDTIFRDVFARVAVGGRLSLTVAILGTAVSTVIGTIVGVAAGYFEGVRVRVDHILDALALSSLALSASLAMVEAHRGAWRAAALAGTLAVSASVARTIARAVGALKRGSPRAAPAGSSGLRRSGVHAPDLLDSAFAGAALATPFVRGAAVVDDHRFAIAVVTGGIVVAAVRVLWTRTRTRHAIRAIPFARVEIDEVLMRSVDVLLAFPFLLLLMAVSAAVERTSEATIVLVLGLTAWTHTARLVRARTLQLKAADFVLASRALGQSTPLVLLRHVVPNLAGLLAAVASNAVAYMIIAEAALAFLGLSLPPPTPSWGRMLDEGRAYYAEAPWLIVSPAAAIFLAVLGMNLIGEGLRGALEPQDDR